MTQRPHMRLHVGFVQLFFVEEKQLETLFQNSFGAEGAVSVGREAPRKTHLKKARETLLSLPGELVFWHPRHSKFRRAAEGKTALRSRGKNGRFFPSTIKLSEVFLTHEAK